MQTNHQFSDIVSISVPDFECEKGWHSIISSAVLCIDRHVSSVNLSEYSSMAEFQVLQIKEKFGGLRIYCSHYDDYIHGILALAETMAYRTCEITGDPGSLHKKEHTMKTLSPAMAEKYGYESIPHNHRKAII